MAKLGVQRHEARGAASHRGWRVPAAGRAALGRRAPPRAPSAARSAPPTTSAPWTAPRAARPAPARSRSAGCGAAEPARAVLGPDGHDLPRHEDPRPHLAAGDLRGVRLQEQRLGVGGKPEVQRHERVCLAHGPPHPRGHEARASRRPVRGTVVPDETWIGGKPSNRHADKRTNAGSGHTTSSPSSL